MNQFKKFIEEIKDILDEEKRITAYKNILQKKIDKIKRIEKAKKELDSLKKELDIIENGKNNK